ncbi:MAG: cupin domain-containing protein [Deltaproteobacteria bacterium]|nr:cupin domain-containing protein [Deltaproteobacteria bacterium]
MFPALFIPVLLTIGPAAEPSKPTQPVAPTTAKGAVIERDRQPVYPIAGGKAGARVLLDETTAPGLKEAAMTELIMLPGTVVPEHVHERSAELLYILEGRGMMQLAEKLLEVKPGTAIFIPAGVKHSLRLDTKVEPLRAIQVYTPGGPEQRFKSGTPVKE